MSERESLSGDSIQRWKGVNQRTQPTLVTDGFLSLSYGVFFNDEGVTRLLGKRLAARLAGPVFNIYAFGTLAIVQTTTSLWAIPIAEILAFNIPLAPDTPDAPTVYGVDYTTLTVAAPPAYPAHTLSFSIQKRLINVDQTGPYSDIPQAWTTLDAVTLPGEIIPVTGLLPGEIWEYRSVATNSYGTIYSAVARVQLLWAPPSVNIPTFSAVVAGNFNILVPAIPSVTVFTILLLTGVDPTNLAHYTSIGGLVDTTIVTPNSASGLMTVNQPSTNVFRYSYTIKKADGTFEAFVTNYASVKVPSSITLTYVSNGDTNGLFYFLGRNFNAIPWTNPYTAGRLGIQMKTLAVYSLDFLVDRTINYVLGVSSAGSWIAFDLGQDHKLIVSKYSLQSYNSTLNNWTMQTWKLQGSNDVAGTSIAAHDAATWVDIDSQVNNVFSGPNIWKTLTVSPTPAAYRWFRILQTGTNIGGGNDLNLGEVELYGTFTY